uniref:BPTI/Kunitz inhibitor domain-containing protein n=1 Tax=Denticeps clupeoides TaxID=299321 RepID=A0AAY4CLI3_9TELE
MGGSSLVGNTFAYETEDPGSNPTNYLSKTLNPKLLQGGLSLILLAIRADNKDSHCTQSPINGPCLQGETKLYDNPYEDMCSPFYYGGCDGNENQFNAENECKDTCSGFSFAVRATVEVLE